MSKQTIHAQVLMVGDDIECNDPIVILRLNNETARIFARYLYDYVQLSVEGKEEEQSNKVATAAPSGLRWEPSRAQEGRLQGSRLMLDDLPVAWISHRAWVGQWGWYIAGGRRRSPDVPARAWVACGTRRAAKDAAERFVRSKLAGGPMGDEEHDPDSAPAASMNARGPWDLL